jgi:hypothetical protein
MHARNNAHSGQVIAAEIDGIHLTLLEASSTDHTPVP